MTHLPSGVYRVAALLMALSVVSPPVATPTVAAPSARPGADQRCRPVPTSLRLASHHTTGGETVAGSVRTSCSAHRAVTVVLDASPGMRVPKKVTVPRGARKATFVVTTAKTAAVRSGVVTAARRGRSVSASLTVSPSAPAWTVRVVPHPDYPGPHVGGQRGVYFYVELAHPTPVGVVVHLSVDGPVFMFGDGVYIPAGGALGQFQADIGQVTSTQHLTFTATLPGDPPVTDHSPLIVHPAIAAANLPSSVVGGTSFTGTVQMAGAADADQVLYLQPWGGAADCAQAMVLPAGTTQLSFNCTAVAVEQEIYWQVQILQGREDTMSSQILITPPPD